MFIGVVDEMPTWGNILHKVGTGEFKPVERFCHWNYRYLHLRLSSKVSWFSESGHLLLVKISHILAGLGPPGSRAEPRTYPGKLPFELQHSLNQVNGEGKWRSQILKPVDQNSLPIISSLEPSKNWKVSLYTPLREIDRITAPEFWPTNH